MKFYKVVREDGPEFKSAFIERRRGLFQQHKYSRTAYTSHGYVFNTLKNAEAWCRMLQCNYCYILHIFEVEPEYAEKVIKLTRSVYYIDQFWKDYLSGKQVCYNQTQPPQGTYLAFNFRLGNRVAVMEP